MDNYYKKYLKYKTKYLNLLDNTNFKFTDIEQIGGNFNIGDIVINSKNEEKLGTIVKIKNEYYILDSKRVIPKREIIGPKTKPKFPKNLRGKIQRPPWTLYWIGDYSPPHKKQSIFDKLKLLDDENYDSWFEKNFPENLRRKIRRIPGTSVYMENEDSSSRLPITIHDWNPGLSYDLITGERKGWETPLNMDEYDFSKTVRIFYNQTYNPIELRGFFTHGIHNNIETFINILKDKIILPRNRISSLINTGTDESVINSNLISLSTITVEGGKPYKIYGERGITFITNKINYMNLTKQAANMPNEFFINQLNLDKTYLLLDEKLKTLKIKDIPMLTESLNIHSFSYKDTIKKKILFLIDEFQITYIEKEIINKEENLESLKKIYYDIIYKLFDEKTFLEVVNLLLAKYDVAIDIVFLNFI